MTKIELLDVDGNIVTRVETDNPETEFEHFKVMLPAIISWREQTASEEEQLATLKASTLSAIKAKLADTDYKCLKYVDNELTEAEYADVKAERHNLRVAYNAIQATTTLAELNAIEVIW